jgi:hypothetical protein
MWMQKKGKGGKKERSTTTTASGGINQSNHNLITK